MSQCSHAENEIQCTNEAFNDHNNCILHADLSKIDADDDYKQSLNKQFISDLEQHIYEKLISAERFKDSLEIISGSPFAVRRMTISASDNISKRNQKKAETEQEKEKLRDYLGEDSKDKIFGTIIIKNIVFHDFVDEQEVSRIFNKFEQIKIIESIFYINRIKIKNKITYYDCTFNKDFYVCEGEQEPCFIGSCFNQNLILGNYNLSPVSQKEVTVLVSEIVLLDCDFHEEGHLFINHIVAKGKVFNYTNSFLVFQKRRHLNTIFVFNSTFDCDSLLNHTTIDYLLVNNSRFNGRFYANQANVNYYLSIINTEFNDEFDISNSFFNALQIEKTTFNKGAILSSIKCKKLKNFSNEIYFIEDTSGYQIHPKKHTSFCSTKFIDYSIFNNSEFEDGLNLSDAILQQTPNLSGVRLSTCDDVFCSKDAFANTDKQTFRLSKSALDSSGNFIEANKFYALEMRKYGEELSWRINSGEKLIHFFNKYVSNFGQSYLLPIIWIVFFGLAYSVLSNYLHCVECAVEEKSYPHSSFTNQLAFILNSLANSIVPIARFLKDGMEFISLVFYIIFAVLIWQTIVAVKRHSRR